MDLPQNRFLKAIKDRRPLWGCWLGLPDPSVAEIVASAGFDWLLVDHEHAPFELSDVMSHLRAIEPYPVATLVRPVSAEPALLKKFLEMGVQSFVIPMINNAEEARACVDALFYPPVGHRGVGTSLARAARWNQVPDYLHHANDEMCLVVQAETTEALNNLDSILAVDHVHGVFLGPSDLAASMGKIGQSNDPDLHDTCVAAIKTIKAAGKIAGILTMSEALIDKSVDAGADFIGVGVDTVALGTAVRALAAKHREKVS